MILYSIIISEEEIQAIVKIADHAERRLADVGWSLGRKDGQEQLETVRQFISNLVDRVPLK